MKNKQMIVVAVIVVAIAGIVAFAVGATGDQAKVAAAGKARYILMGHEDCDACMASKSYVEQALAGQDVYFEFVDIEKTPGAIPAVDGADAEGALVNVCDAGDHTTVVYPGGHFASVEEAVAVVGAGATSEKFTFAYAGDGCDNCLAVKAAFERLSSQYDPATLELRYVDINAQAAEAAEAKLTKAHALSAWDSDGCTGYRDGEIGTDDASILKVLQDLPIAPQGTTAQ